MTGTTTAVQRLPSRMLAWLMLLRPLNVVMFAAGVGVGGVLTAGGLEMASGAVARLAVAACSAALIGGAANAINDVFDLDTDRVNRPGRPLPSGRATPREARVLWALATLAGLVLAATLSAEHVAIALASAMLLYGYSVLFKRMPVVGNVIVALVLALSLVYGGLAVGGPGPALVGAAFAFFATLAREIVKDLEDVRGDAAVHARTLPIVAGEQTAVYAAAAVTLLAVLLTPVPYLTMGYSGLYLLLVLATDALLLRAVALLLGVSGEVQAGRASRALKGAMMMGLAALASAGWTGI